MRCATDHEPCRQNLATLESSFGGVTSENLATLASEEEGSNNNLDDCAEALDMVKDHIGKHRNDTYEVIHMETNQSCVTYHKEDTPSSPSNQGSYFDDF